VPSVKTKYHAIAVRASLLISYASLQVLDVAAVVGAWPGPGADTAAAWRRHSQGGGDASPSATAAESAPHLHRAPSASTRPSRYRDTLFRAVLSESSMLSTQRGSRDGPNAAAAGSPSGTPREDWIPVETQRSTAEGDATGTAGGATAPSVDRISLLQRKNRILAANAAGPIKTLPSAGSVRQTDARRLAAALSFMGTFSPDAAKALPHVGPRRGSASGGGEAGDDAAAASGALQRASDAGLGSSVTFHQNALPSHAAAARARQILDMQAATGKLPSLTDIAEVQVRACVCVCVCVWSG
jgi:hypothetical protein